MFLVVFRLSVRTHINVTFVSSQDTEELRQKQKTEHYKRANEKNRPQHTEIGVLANKYGPNRRSQDG